MGDSLLPTSIRENALGLANVQHFAFCPVELLLHQDSPLDKRPRLRYLCYNKHLDL